MPWNYGDLLEAVGAAVDPAAPAFIHGTRTIAWGEAMRRMNNLSRAMTARGAKAGDKVAFYLRNGMEYGEALGACFLARLVHANVNYRYRPEEVHYILDNSDAQTVFYNREFRDVIAQIHNQLPKVKTFIEVGGAGEGASFAEPYEKLAATGEGRPLAGARSPEDMLFIYTGGTTGMPKGVMYTVGDLCRWWQDRLLKTVGAAPQTIAEVAGMVKALPVKTRSLPASPQMHGVGMVNTMMTMMMGGTVVTVDSHSFDPHAIWAAAQKNRVDTIAIVGDPFARPLLDALDEAPGRYDLSSVLTITSSGAMWSAEVKQGLFRHLPQVTLNDGLGSSEALGMGAAISTRDEEVRTAGFTLGDYAIVIDENDKPIEKGSDKPGLLAVAGFAPLGYYKDPEKSARTFRLIDGKRYSIPGDYVLVDADGTLTLLGRGSNCINTGGEKVFPEEVEEVLKTHPAVADALVVGVVDEKWGQAVTAVVQLAACARFDEAALRTHVREKLAGYKTPKRIVVAEVPLRSANGKADYKAAAAVARRALDVAG